jgi:oligoendopeptidase F
MFFDKKWIHASLIKGKMSGAFSHPTVPSCHPYILLNFQGKIRDVMTLAHELGHGIHQYLANKNGLLISDTPLTLAETASVFGEMLTFKFLLKSASKKSEKIFLLRSKVEDMLNTVVRQVSFFDFERRIHSLRVDGEIPVEDICKIWIKSQKESLGNHVNIDNDYKYFWSYIPHFIHSPFYVYAYAFGDCLVNTLYSRYEDKFPNFNKKYIKLLQSGGSLHYKDSLKEFNLNPSRKDFWELGIKIIKNFIDELEKLS